MRLTRVIAMLLAVEILFLGGSAYYTLVFPVRVLHHIVITLVLALWLVLRLRSGQGLPHTPLNLPLFAAAGVWCSRLHSAPTRVWPSKICGSHLPI
jgi:hypothetical protein